MLKVEPHFETTDDRKGIRLSEVVLVYNDAGLKQLLKALRTTPKGGWTIVGDVSLLADGSNDPANGIVFRLLRRG